ncbi:MAG TPA: hypothetical protein VII59_21130 [Streptosporangiaceae bacterium]
MAEAAGWTTILTSRRPAAGFRKVDLAEPDTLEKVIDEADVIVSTVPDKQVVAERMVLDRGGLLINVSALAASSAAGLLREPERPRGTVVMNAGIAPGVTNLLAAGPLAPHPEADEVELVFTVSLKGSHGPASGDVGNEWLTAAKRHRTTVVRLPRRTAVGAASASPSSTAAGWARSRPARRSAPTCASPSAACTVPCWPRARSAARATTAARPPRPS